MAIPPCERASPSCQRESARSPGALIGTRLVQVIGARRQLVLGPGLAAVGLFWLSTVGAGDSYLSHVLGPVILIGLGIGMSWSR